MILEVKDLSYHYFNSRTIFENVNFSVDKGEVLSIIGTNGAGKSTLLNCVANLFRPETGKILLNGQSIRDMKLIDVAKVIGYVPQNHNAVYSYSVLEFVVMGRTPYIGFLSSPKKSDYTIAEEAMAKMHILHLKDKAYTEISGGERQLALIARVLAQQPQLILLDEPTSHLDYGNQFRTVCMIKELSEMGYGIIMTTHMPDHAIILNDKVGVLDKSGHLAVGPVNEIMSDERLSRLYNVNIKTQFIDVANRSICVTCPADENNSFSASSLDYEEFNLEEGILNKEDYLWSQTTKNT